MWMLISFCFGFCATGLIAQWLFFRFVKRKQAEENAKGLQTLRILNKHWVFIGAMLICVAGSAGDKQKTAYLVTITRTSSEQFREFKVYCVTEPSRVDSLVEWNFGFMFPEFDTKKVCQHTHHFQLLADHCELYCEEKEIIGYKKNGRLKLKKLK